MSCRRREPRLTSYRPFQTLVFPEADHSDIGQQPDHESRVAAALAGD